jgi:TPR repeat protein
LTVNYQKAFEYYYEACNYGISEAFIRLGNMYKYVRFW